MLCSNRVFVTIEKVPHASVTTSGGGDALRLVVVKGDTAGLNEGNMLGISLGEEVGISVGEEVGISVGEEVGISLGKEVGISLGKELGIALGEEVGILLGKEVTAGAAVGKKRLPELHTGGPAL